MRLTPLPTSFPATVAALHRVAEDIVAPARKPDNEIALYPTPGGFGTPVFEYGGVRRRVRVEGDELVSEHRVALRSLEAARGLVGDLVPEPVSEDPLSIDSAAATVIGEWYAFAHEVLSAFAAAEARLWPEHFDLAIELDEVNYGFSPGDEQHAEPYAYVGPWSAEVAGALWNATGFRGAELTYAELAAGEDPRAAALEFMTTRKEALR